MSNFYARACKNGHVNITYRRAGENEHCPECGLPLIDSCPECGNLLKQWHYYGMVYLTPKNLKFELPDVCPKCGSRNLTKIDRMNGYLSYSRVKGDTRLNAAKMAEIAERKSM